MTRAQRLRRGLDLTTNPTENGMKPSHPRRARPMWALGLLMAAIGVAPALATGSSSAAKSEARYQRDAAICLSSRYTGDKDECLSEASTARAGREPATIDLDPGRYARNVLKRCEPLPQDDRLDCIARMQGRGTTTGSVASGGIYREMVTREVGVAPAVAPAK